MSLINTYLPHHLRREHNVNVVSPVLSGGELINTLVHTPKPKIELPKKEEIPLMNEIEKIFDSIPNFPTKNPAKDNTRKNVIQDGKMGEAIEAMVLGKVRSYSEKQLVQSSISRKGRFELLESKLRELVKLHNPRFRYTSIQVNKAVETNWHWDRGNVGLSYCIAFGDFTGGGVVVRTKNGEKTYNNKRRWLYYDGHNIEHKSAPSKGTRYAVIFFTKS